MRTEGKLLQRESTTVKIALVLGFTFLTALGAQVRLPLPWSPVPVTAQSFVVLLGPVLIGSWAGLSQVLYLMFGIAGMPWFALQKQGFSALFGPTGGYLVGFVFASLVLGYVVKSEKSSSRLLLWLILANFGVIYGFGLIQLYGWLALKGSTPGFLQIFSMGALPFIPGDLTKILLVYSIAHMFRKSGISAAS